MSPIMVAGCGAAKAGGKMEVGEKQVKREGKRKRRMRKGAHMEAHLYNSGEPARSAGLWGNGRGCR